MRAGLILKTSHWQTLPRRQFSSSEATPLFSITQTSSAISRRRSRRSGNVVRFYLRDFGFAKSVAVVVGGAEAEAEAEVVA